MALWGKDDQERVDETVAYIAGRVPVGEQGATRNFLNKFIAGRYPSPSSIKTLSNAMSTNAAATPGDKQIRAARRALVIVRGDMMKTNNPLRMNASQIMALPPSQVEQSLTAMMPAFRLFVAQEEGNNMPLQASFNDLKIMTEAFLRKNIVVTQSWVPVNGAGSVLPHTFTFDYQEQLFRLLPSALGNPPHIKGTGLTVSVVTVPEMFWFDVPNNNQGQSFTGIPATAVTGADMMVTSAFTGCSFCFKEVNGSLYAAHISPDGTLANKGPNIGPAPKLATQLSRLGNFASPQAAQAGPLQVFGKKFSNLDGKPFGYSVDQVPGNFVSTSVYIFGVKNGDQWKLVCQENMPNNRQVYRLN